MINTKCPNQEVFDYVLIALRRIMRAIDLHSKKLMQSHHLTIPQAILLREIQRRRGMTLGDLAKRASLSNATVTGIVDRLEARQLVKRVRSAADRRQVLVEMAPSGQELLKTMPSLLQDNFIRELQSLQKWEQTQILSSLERVASIMNADSLEAGPILTQHPLTAREDDVENGTNPQRKLDPENADSATAHHPRPDPNPEFDFHLAKSLNELPKGIDIKKLTSFLHESLKPYEDTPEDIERGIRDAVTAEGRKGGFILTAELGSEIAGALVMQRTGMKGYVPENILLFVAVSPPQRGKGIGRRLIERAIQLADGNVKLHVEYDNPAFRLYERLGFTSKYAEMRYLK